jgi:hypothetical protein
LAVWLRSGDHKAVKRLESARLKEARMRRIPLLQQVVMPYRLAAAQQAARMNEN